MEDGDSNKSRWEYAPVDILVKIFQLLDIFELTSGIDDVCSAWHMACCDPLLWKTLDLSMLKSDFIKTGARRPPFVYVSERSDGTLTRLLKISLSLSRGSIMTLIFHFNLYLSDDQLTYTAERCPNLRRLVLPAWSRLKEEGILKAIRGCKYLESLTMPSIANPPYHLKEIATMPSINPPKLLKEISTHCKNFSTLKIMGPCDIFFASSLAAFLPKLKVLSLRCSMLYKEALICILDKLQHLEVLNISHCILIEVLPPPQHERVIKEIDSTIRQKASRLSKFLTCMDDSCIMCQRTRTDEGLVRWYRYEEGLWKADEVKSLAL